MHPLGPPRPLYSINSANSHGRPFHSFPLPVVAPPPIPFNSNSAHVENLNPNVPEFVPVLPTAEKVEQFYSNDNSAPLSQKNSEVSSNNNRKLNIDSKVDSSDKVNETLTQENHLASSKGKNSSNYLFIIFNFK